MEQAELLQYAIHVLERECVPYMLVGSLASGVFGEARFTADIDFVVDLNPLQVDDLCSAFAAPEFYVSVSAAHNAVRRGGQFNVIHPSSGNKIDFMIARRDEWGLMQLTRRRREVVVPGLIGYVAAPEDVIISKMIYYREGESEKHLRDISSMMRISAEEIDREYVARWAEQLQLIDIWQALVTRVDGASH